MMTTKNAPTRRFLIATAVAGMILGAPGFARAEMVNCVQFVKKVSAIALHGNAYEWWDAADGAYARGTIPQAGAVMVFSKSRHLPYGHVAVVEKKIDERTILIDHANWSVIAGHRGHVERSVRVVDVSENNDWSKVKVWYASLADVGNTSYSLRGFVYPNTPRPPAHVGKPIRLHAR
jgi:surface antigen